MGKRQGWIRLGIVISVIFLASLHFFLYLNHQELSSSITSSSSDTTTSDVWEVVGLESRFFSCSAAGSTSDCKIKLVPYVIATLTPLLVLWGLIPALVSTYRWVRSGFKGQ